MPHSNTYDRKAFYPSGETGSALLVCLFVLVILTTLGALAINTSIVETKISGNEQQWQSDFNIAEGGALLQAGYVGFASADTCPWYQISDPENIDIPLVPDSADYDPGGDMGAGVASNYPLALTNSWPTDASNRSMWPRQNLQQNTTDNTMDYAYLVTFLGESEKAPKGYNAADFSFYRFQIDGAKQIGPEIEVGGIKIGPKL